MNIRVPICERVDMYKLLPVIGACNSGGEARRLIKQGAVKVYEGRDSLPIVITERNWMIEDGMILKCGKHFWRELKMPKVDLEIQKTEYPDRTEIKILDIQGVNNDNI